MGLLSSRQHTIWACVLHELDVYTPRYIVLGPVGTYIKMAPLKKVGHTQDPVGANSQSALAMAPLVAPLAGAAAEREGGDEAPRKRRTSCTADPTLLSPGRSSDQRSTSAAAGGAAGGAADVAANVAAADAAAGAAADAGSGVAAGSLTSVGSVSSGSAHPSPEKPDSQRVELSKLRQVLNNSHKARTLTRQITISKVPILGQELLNAAKAGEHSDGHILSHEDIGRVAETIKQAEEVSLTHTRPISPICQSPFFPYLTFQFCF